MRDVERLKEKIQISLDDRQVWALGLSGLLLLGGVFTIGMLVGRKSGPPAQGAQGDLAALDARGASERPAAPLAVSTAMPLVVPNRLPPPAPKAEALAVQQAALAAPPAEEKPASDESEKPAAEKASQGRAPSHAAAEPRPPAVVPAPRPAAVIPAPQRPMQVASATVVSLTAAPHQAGEFTVQIGSSQDRAEALHMENKARSAGLKPYSVAADLGKKGTWYRVRVGAFHDKDAANRYRRDVERELRANAVVMSTR